MFPMALSTTWSADKRETKLLEDFLGKLVSHQHPTSLSVGNSARDFSFNLHRPDCLASVLQILV